LSLFSKKSPEEKEREKQIKNILGHHTRPQEVKELFEKYNRGG
jgi:hypothetical protein